MATNTLTAAEYPQVSAPALNELEAAKPASAIRLNGHAVIFSLSTILALATASECRSITHIPSLLYGIVLWTWWGCIASAIWKLGQRAPLLSNFSPKPITLHIVQGASLAMIHLLLLGSLGFMNTRWQAHTTAFAVWTSLININRFGLEILIYGFVFGLIRMIQYQIRAQREAIHSLELQRQLSTAHLRALQMQLEPHFLFNTLNAITTLVELGRQEPAVEMLSHLNAILKSTLKRTTPVKVPLSQELEIVENYLAIEQVRFADRLQIAMRVDPNALDGLVPCFLLQPIVENAIRHGIAHCENEGLVEATVQRNGSFLDLRIRDTGPGLGTLQQDGHGIGLKNTRERLAHFYHDDFAMKAQPLAAGGYEVSITIPYERG
jgi:sensor histidine kinase YesM